MRRFLSFRDFDWALLGMVLLLCTVSVLEIYSATLHTKYIGFHTKQMFWIARRPGGHVPLFQNRLSPAAGLGSLGLWFQPAGAGGRQAGGTQRFWERSRWIKIGPMHFQPSEWVKLILILAVARYFANLGGRRLTWTDIFKALVLVGIPMALVLIQPDLGTALTYTPILVAGLFLGGINLRQALVLTICAAVLVAGVWTDGFGIGRIKVLKAFQKARLTSFLNPDNDPLGTGYQTASSR